MGSVGVDADDDGSIVKEFLQRCEPSGDAAYGELRALLARLHDPATRRDARLFLAALHRHQQRSSSAAGGLTHEQFFRRFGFRMQELLLQDTATDITASSFIATKPAAAAGFYIHIYIVFSVLVINNSFNLFPFFNFSIYLYRIRVCLSTWHITFSLTQLL